MLWILLVLVVGPIVELWFILQVAGVIGGWQTLGLLLIEGAIGSWLIKRQGRSVISRIDERLRANSLPTTELADGFLILSAGVLMLAPGFISDIVGFALLFPPTRALARALLVRRFTSRMGQGFGFVAMPGAMFGGSGFGRGAFGGGTVYDTTATTVDEEPPRRATPNLPSDTSR